jgi:putative ABC transport system permease protein
MSGSKREWLSRLVRTSRKGSADADLDAELSFHIEMEAAEYERSGMAPAEARRRALLAFGGRERFREAAMGERAGRPLEDLLRDIRQGARALLRSPLYALVTVLSLGLGIGAATAVFTLADRVLLRSLVYGSADRLYTLYEAKQGPGIRVPSYPTFLDWQQQLTAFDAVTYVRGDEFLLRGDDGTQRLLAGYASAGYFETLQTPPVLGRVFGGDAADETHVVVLSHDVWQRRFGGDPDVLGATISTTDGSFTVIGVMPRGFRVPAWADVWTPIAALPAHGAYALSRRDLHVDAEVWGAIRPGVSRERAEADLTRVAALMSREYPELNADWPSAEMTSVRELVVGNVGEQFRIVAAAVLLLLLIVCVNVSGLQLARGSARSREMAVRATLGAGRGRLVRQLMAENLLLAVVGGVLGVLLAAYAVAAFTAAAPTVLPRLDEVGIGVRTLLFACAAAILCALGFGIVPAVRASAGAIAATLRPGSGGSIGGGARLRSALVVAQVALALVMTIGSGLLLRSLWTLQQQDLGFEPAQVVTLRAFPPAQYADPEAAATLYRELQGAVRAVPGVAEVALTNHLPFAGGWMVTQLQTGGDEPEAGNNVIVRTVSAEYFDVMGARRLQGRLLEDDDLRSVGAGVVVNEELARRFFGSDSPLGRSVTFFHSAQGRDDFGEPITATIVGVVGSERYFDLAADAPPAIFVPWTWMVWPNITLAARTSVPPQTLLPALRRAVQQVERDIPVAGPALQAEWRTLESAVSGTLQQRRLMAWLLTGFAAAAVLLALLGIFGITAYSVTRRTREIGVRRAIGAPRRAVTRLVLGHALVLALCGIAIGLPVSSATARLLDAQLFGVAATDPWTISFATGTFLLAALLSALVPTARALRIAPSEALRTD